MDQLQTQYLRETLWYLQPGKDWELGWGIISHGELAFLSLSSETSDEIFKCNLQHIEFKLIKDPIDPSRSAAREKARFTKVFELRQKHGVKDAWDTDIVAADQAVHIAASNATLHARWSNAIDEAKKSCRKAPESAFEPVGFEGSLDLSSAIRTPVTNLPSAPLSAQIALDPEVSLLMMGKYKSLLQVTHKTFLILQRESNNVNDCNVGEALAAIKSLHADVLFADVDGCCNDSIEAGSLSERPATEPDVATRASRYLSKLDHAIKELVTQLDMLTETGLSPTARRACSMLLSNFCDTLTPLVQLHERLQHPLRSSHHTLSSTRGTLTTLHDAGLTGCTLLQCLDSTASPDISVLPGIRFEPRESVLGRVTASNPNPDTEGLQDVHGSREQAMVKSGGPRCSTGMMLDVDADMAQAREANGYLNTLARPADTAKPLMLSSRLPYMQYWYHAQAI